jgi:hypothetical protein
MAAILIPLLVFDLKQLFGPFLLSVGAGGLGSTKTEKSGSTSEKLKIKN